MYSDLEYKKTLMIGLIIIFALSFLFGGIEILKRELPKENHVATVIEDKPEESEDAKAYEVDPNKPMIALTFDDGPSKYTMQILEQLEAYNSRATFFMVGTNVGKYPETVKKMKKIGCELGNHSTNHAKLTELTPDLILGEIAGTNQAVTGILGHGTEVFRPPYGAVDDNVAALIGAPVVLWSVDTLDWELKNSEQVRDYILTNVQDGDIVLLHDLYESTAQAMMEVIPKLIEQGYQLVTVSEMAKARGVTLQNGLKYGNFRK